MIWYICEEVLTENERMNRNAFNIKLLDSGDGLNTAPYSI